jgi:magnesium transporter
MPHALFGPELLDMLETRDEAGLAAFCESMHPVTISEAIDDFPAERIWDVIGQADIRTQASIFEYLPEAKQDEMIVAARPQVGQLITKMSHDDRVDLLRRVPAAVSERLLRMVDDADRKDISALFTYGENTVGAIMTTDYAWLPPTLTAAEAVDQLRSQAPDKETIYYIYVLDEARKRADGTPMPRKLLGVISLRDLILSPRFTLVRDLMETDLVALNINDDRSKASELLGKYDFIAMPVLDETNGMVGIVTHDDVLDVIEAEATEDMQRQGGMSPLARNYMDASFASVWKSRAFWLAMLFVAELATFSVMQQFEHVISSVVVLSLFVPLCISTGGNSGSQAATLITRAVALGQIHPRDWKRVLRRELLMGVALGITLGVVAFFRGAITTDDTRSSPQLCEQPFQVTADSALGYDKMSGDFYVPTHAIIARSSDRVQYIRPTQNSVFPKPTMNEGRFTYNFPANCEIRTVAVSRWQLAQVIAFSVMGICLWGTLIGAMLPLVFKQINLDPAVASGPFVATFVDVTGIVIFFSMAQWLMLGH